MRYKITRHEEVRFDLSAILDFVGNYAGYKAGYQKVEDINVAISRLRRFPHVGTINHEVSTGLRALPVAEKR